MPKSLELVAKAVLVDIEGTTTSISFVHDVLFPYAKKNAFTFLKDTWSSDETQRLVEELMGTPQYVEYAATVNTDGAKIDNVTAFIHYLIDKDLKVTPLKTLQGLIWAKGYTAGQLKGHVYEDVPVTFQSWREAGLIIAVYSSGSVAAQKLIFGHSIAGNLLPHISAHFDTHVGHKQQEESYTNIAKALNVPPEEVLFLTDVVGEAAAARAAGMQSVILQRPGNAPLTADQTASHKIADNFLQLRLSKTP